MFVIIFGRRLGTYRQNAKASMAFLHIHEDNATKIREELTSPNFLDVVKFVDVPKFLCETSPSMKLHSCHASGSGHHRFEEN